MSNLPPPLPPLPPAPPKKQRAWPWVVGALVIAGSVAGAINRDDDDGDDNSPGERMSLVEAVCGMLNDGEDRELVYAVARDLAADHPSVYGEDEAFAARTALNRAVAQGCG